jgi:hypothetical protein
MVIKGRFSKRPPRPVIVIPKSYNPYITEISVLKSKPLQQDAINLLYEISDIVMPVMKQFGLKVKKLVEMSPRDDALLGLNVNHGSQIKLRLRPPRNDLRLLPINDLVGTMLHELTHNTCGPHDAKFYKKLEEYIEKQESFMRQGINGKSILSPFAGNGKAIGGRAVVDVRNSRLARLDKQFTMGVRKLGGKAQTGDPRKLAAEAAIKRAEDNKWCHDLEDGESANDDDLVGGTQNNDSDDDVIVLTEEEVIKDKAMKEKLLKEKSLKESTLKTEQKVTELPGKRPKEIEVVVIDDDEDDDYEGQVSKKAKT